MNKPPLQHFNQNEVRDLPPRIVTEFRAAETGPTLIILASIHGNEPAGTQALQRIAETLNQPGNKLRLRGECIGLIGNRRAHARNQRIIQRDLNRAWTSRNLQRLESLSASELQQSSCPEDLEQLELLKTLSQITQRAGGPIYFLDLHTTSAPSRPFILLGDTLRNRAFARKFPIPIVLGLEEQIDGTITEWMTAQGYISIGFEAGQHRDPHSVDRHEAVIWLAIAAAGLTDHGHIPKYEHQHRLLRAAAGNLPQFIEVRYRHGITAESQFQMHPGYENLQPVQKGQALAADHAGPVRSREDGRVLLPLYQKVGADGFFICRDVKPIWLRLSRLLRRLHAHRLAPFFPGVRRCSRRPGTLLVNSRIARWLAHEVFHLLGFRKQREEDNYLVVSRRRFDYE